jgi:hypothetical protein
MRTRPLNVHAGIESILSIPALYVVDELGALIKVRNGIWEFGNRIMSELIAIGLANAGLS